MVSARAATMSSQRVPALTAARLACLAAVWFSCLLGPIDRCECVTLSCYPILVWMDGAHVLVYMTRHDPPRELYLVLLYIHGRYCVHVVHVLYSTDQPPVCPRVVTLVRGGYCSLRVPGRPEFFTLGR